MLEEGVADAEAIDPAMELGYRHPMGPLRSTDLVGLDVRLAIAEYLHRTLGDRFAPPQLLRDKVAARRAGPQDRPRLLRLPLRPYSCTARSSPSWATVATCVPSAAQI